jgi:ATP-dependent DNA helicase RecG
MIITVSEGTRKPYSCPRGFYLRTGPSSQKLERDSIIEFFRSEDQVRYDEIVRDDLPITERFNEAAYKRYVRLAKISDVLDQKAILKNLNCAAEAGGKLCFTNAGALFFRINDEDVEFRHAGVVCALYKGTDKVYILDAKEMNGDLLSNIDDAMVFLKKHLRMSFKIKSVRRENILELPEDALREAVINAVCHRNLFEKGARVMVEIFDDRVDIVNPGGVPKGITPENFGTISITRNSVIASMLYRADYIEQMGTGITRMRNEAKEANVAEPEFELLNFFKVTFRRNAVQETSSSDSQATVSDSQATFKRQSSDSQATANNRKMQIINYLEANERATAPDIADYLGKGKSWARTILRQMTNDGMIEKCGDNRFTYYVLKK